MGDVVGRIEQLTDAGPAAPLITIDWKGVLNAAGEREQALRSLLARCLGAVESDMIDAADMLRANKGYPARDARYRQRLADATKLHEDVKAACSPDNTPASHPRAADQPPPEPQS